MKPFTFRAVIRLGPAALDSQGRDYPSGSRAVMARASSPRIAHRKYFEARIEPDGEPYLRHGDREAVTIMVTGGQAASFLAPGHRFALRNGHDIGTGVACQRAFTAGSPS